MSIGGGGGGKRKNSILNFHFVFGMSSLRLKREAIYKQTNDEMVRNHIDNV